MLCLVEISFGKRESWPGAYLEAEAAGICATSIGCYFDDTVHEVVGISSRAWQSLYHFTVGGPVEDSRLFVGHFDSAAAR